MSMSPEVAGAIARDLEIAIAEYVDWFNMRPPHGELGMIPPIEAENRYYRLKPQPATAELVKTGSKKPGTYHITVLAVNESLEEM
jgi:hypothetical protein